MVAGWRADRILFQEAWRHLGHARARRRGETTDHVRRSSGLVARWPDDCLSVSFKSRPGRIRDGRINHLHCFLAGRLAAVADAPRLSSRLAFRALLVARWQTHRVPQLRYGFIASLDDLRRGRRIEANHSAGHWRQNLSLLFS